MAYIWFPFHLISHHDLLIAIANKKLLEKGNLDDENSKFI